MKIELERWSIVYAHRINKGEFFLTCQMVMAFLPMAGENCAAWPNVIPLKSFKYKSKVIKAETDYKD